VTVFTHKSLKSLKSLDATIVKTDTIFYSIFQTFPSFFFELIHQSPETAADYEFTSREIKQLAFRQDGLFLPKNNKPSQPFYLLEVQFQPDETLYYRVFAELFLYLKQYCPVHPWRVVIIYPSRSVERLQNTQFGDLLALGRVQRIYLDELGVAAQDSLGAGVVKLVVASEEAAAEQAKQLIAQAKHRLTDDAVRQNLINLIETIIVYKLPKKSREEVAAMLGLSELKQTRFYQEVFEEGKLEGIEEGLQEGKQAAKLEAIAPLLQLDLSLDTIANVLSLPLETVEQTAAQIRQEALFVAQRTVAALIQLLTHQRVLFSPHNLTQLNQLIEPLPDDVEAIYQAISQWLERHLDIQDAIALLLESEQGELTDDTLREEILEDGERRTLQLQQLPNKQALNAAIGNE
jgi:predicted transposase/invertase (TIGR01784 family)